MIPHLCHGYVVDKEGKTWQKMLFICNFMLSQTPYSSKQFI